MSDLTVYFDGACTMCAHCRTLFAKRAALIPLRWVDARGQDAVAMRAACPGLCDELHVATSDGAVWAGANAFRMVLWASAGWHTFATWLDFPILHELSSFFFDWLAAHRVFAGQLMGIPVCTNAHCAAKVHRT
ncbi:MAG: DUF393 domain-containing protein [Sandaracinaceae bacterium]|nr:DUF393 domain-containing protein [Sandaracinaceae bacterium]